MSTKNKQADFSDLSTHDAIALVTNNAVVARQSGHPVTVSHATIEGQKGIVIWIPNYVLADGRIQKVKEAANEPEPET